MMHLSKALNKTVLSIFILFTIVTLISCSKGASEVIEIIPEEESSATATESGTAVTTATTIEEPEVGGPFSQYDGLKVDSDISNLRPLAVMVDNDPAARPQKGLSQASCVYEIVDEGGVTRYVAIFGPNIDPPVVGPVRSARPYYVEVAFSFDALYAHHGGSDQAFETIDYLNSIIISKGGTGFPDIDQIRTGAPFWRDPAYPGWRNAFLDTLKTKEFAENNNISFEGGESPFIFKDDALVGERGSDDTLVLNFSSKTYEAKFVYDPSTNIYAKFLADSPHVDSGNNQQVMAKNIIVQITDIANTGDEKGHMAVRTMGEGKAFFFFDGKVVEGIWKHDSLDTPFQYFDSNGNSIKLNRGLTWVGFLPGEDSISATSLGD
jgi:hypothetical protein